MPHSLLRALVPVPKPRAGTRSLFDLLYVRTVSIRSRDTDIPAAAPNVRSCRRVPTDVRFFWLYHYTLKLCAVPHSRSSVSCSCRGRVVSGITDGIVCRTVISMRIAIRPLRSARSSGRCPVAQATTKPPQRSIREPLRESAKLASI